MKRLLNTLQALLAAIKPEESLNDKKIGVKPIGALSVGVVSTQRQTQNIAAGLITKGASVKERSL